MLQKYVALIGLVNARNEHMRRLFGEMGFSESAYWTSDWCATIRKSAFATTMMAGGEESKAA